MKPMVLIAAFFAVSGVAFSQQATVISKEEIKKSQQAPAPKQPEKDLSVYQDNPKQLNTLIIKRSELRAMPLEQQEKLKKATVQYPKTVKIIED
jgi:hypothetical protein